MRNRPTSIFDSAAERGRSSAFDVDAEPGLRLAWLFVVMLLPLLVVLGRLVHLQAFVAEGFAVETSRELESVETIPARNGRIVSSDGSVLAYDEERFQIHVHYRWLEDPPNDRWLRDEAASRLSRSDRRDPAKMERAKSEVLARRETLWRSLSELLESDLDKLAAVRAKIQQRVERIHDLVEERRTATADSGMDERPDPTNHANLPESLTRAWKTVKQELTTSPTRERREPLRIPEQSEYHLLLEDVPFDAIAEIDTHPDRFPGIKTDVATRRIYPQGRVAPHLVGYRGEIEAAELEARRARFPNGDPLDYRAGDLIGREGIEQSYEHVLRGVRGLRKLIRNPHGTIVRTELIRAPRAGRDVVMNLTVSLQDKATALLREVIPDEPPSPNESGEESPDGGCLIAIDVHTGAILAAATVPTFDVNDFLSGSDFLREALNQDPRRPMFPRATQATLPPGSVFKVVSAVAVLESYRLGTRQRIDPDHPIECIGYLKEPNKNRCYHSMAHYGTDLTKAIAQSCNVYFFKAAQTLGSQPLVLWADRLGIGAPTGIDIPGERAGHLPRGGTELEAQSQRVQLAEHTIRNGKPLQPASPWEDDRVLNAENSTSQPRTNSSRGTTDPLGLVIGQSNLTVTVLQVARLMAAVANDGWLVTPRVVREIAAESESPSPSVDDLQPRLISASEPLVQSLVEPVPVQKQRIRGLTDSTLARVREGLEQVVLTGTGKSVRMKEVAIAGKTGTAENSPKRKDHAWFAGYVPADRPQVAFVVVLEHGGSGGKQAGPVAKKFVQALLDEGLVRGK